MFADDHSPCWFLFFSFKGEHMLNNVGLSASASDIHRLVSFEFGLPKDFTFDMVIFSGGFQDIFNLTSDYVPFQDKPGGTWIRYKHEAIMKRLGITVSGADFVRLRNRYLDDLRIAFNCDVLDQGCGFPKKRESVIHRSDFRLPDRENWYGGRKTYVDLYAYCRQESVERLESLNIGNSGSGQQVSPWRQPHSVTPFPMPYHEVSTFYVPTECHVSRMILHDLNSLTYAYWTKNWLADTPERLKGFRLCPGTPK